MIIKGLLGVVLGLLTTLLNLLPSLPQLPDSIIQVWGQFVQIMNQGMSFVGNWLYLPVALPCLGIVIAIELFEEFYGFIRWFVNKIPFLNIKL